MAYYAERNKLLDDNLELSLEELKEHFYKIYRFFYNKEYFEAAYKGIWLKPAYEDEFLAVDPLFAPSAEIFFMMNLKNKNSYPIDEFYQLYTEAELFTVIEILYDKISTYDYVKRKLNQVDPRKEFASQINNILRFYDDGYFLELNSGTISKAVNEPLKEMLSEDLSEVLSDDVMEMLRTAIKMYYRFDSNLEMKKKAINILGDILEPVRNNLKALLHSEHEIAQKKHDSLIFNIINEFNIRHNKVDQKTEYEREIWYEWMMQYYTSVIITYYKIEQAILNR